MRFQVEITPIAFKERTIEFVEFLGPDEAIELLMEIAFLVSSLIVL